MGPSRSLDNQITACGWRISRIPNPILSAPPRFRPWYLQLTVVTWGRAHVSVPVRFHCRMQPSAEWVVWGKADTESVRLDPLQSGEADDSTRETPLDY
jgi:hypothetical protein